MKILYRRALLLAAVAAALGIAQGSRVHAASFATQVVGYTPGDAGPFGNPAYQTDGTQALGPPTRDTASSTSFGSQVGVFYPPFWTDELVTIGAGGQLTVRFDQPVENSPLNPYGIDLLIFGNAFYVLDQDNRATDVFSEPGVVSVSQDNVTWFDVPGVFADDKFPTLGYSDTVYNGFGNSGGTVLTDFTKPVDPTFDALGKTEAEINAAYADSGGGTGIDLSLVGLDWILYVRVSQPVGDTWSTEIDAFADVAPVPEPSSAALIAVALAGGWNRRRRRSSLN